MDRGRGYFPVRTGCTIPTSTVSYQETPTPPSRSTRLETNGRSHRGRSRPGQEARELGCPVTGSPGPERCSGPEVRVRVGRSLPTPRRSPIGVPSGVETSGWATEGLGRRRDSVLVLRDATGVRTLEFRLFSNRVVSRRPSSFPRSVPLVVHDSGPYPSSHHKPLDEHQLGPTSRTTLPRDAPSPTSGPPRIT